MTRKRTVKVSDFRIDGNRMVIRDTKRRLWERYVDMPIGAWGEVALPIEPSQERTQRTSRKGGR